MLLGSCFAGMAFANAPVGAVHALAYPLGTHFKAAHGLSTSLMLPHVMRFNAAEQRATRLYASIATSVLPGVEPAACDEAKVAQLIDYFARLPAELGIPTHLSQIGVSSHNVESLAEEALLQTRLLPNNLRAVLKSDAAEIYRAAL
jgi:alcohol dehydrogenase class IV